MSDDEFSPPSEGGCWICETGNGFVDSDMGFDMEFDTFFHHSCLEEHGCSTILEYEREGVAGDPVSDG